MKKAVLITVAILMLLLSACGAELQVNKSMEEEMAAVVPIDWTVTRIEEEHEHTRFGWVADGDVHRQVCYGCDYTIAELPHSFSVYLHKIIMVDGKLCYVVTERCAICRFERYTYSPYEWDGDSVKEE